MKEMEHIQPSKALDQLTPIPGGYEIKLEGVTILTVDPAGVKPTLYFTFPEHTRGWHPRPK